MYALAPLVALAAVVGASPPGPPGDHDHSVKHCCKALEEEFPGQVVTSKDAAYEAWGERWADSAELPASCIFRPLSAEDVSFALKTVSRGKGKGCGGDYCPFSIKGGGHTPWAGSNSVDGGVAIDLGHMNQTVIADDRSYVSLGGGTRWHDAYVSVNGSNIAFPGGRCPDTGVGGLTTGGGYSWFSGEKGFVADSMVNFEVVLASGEIVNANADSHADLFKALKGGSNNFGVVTRFDVAAFEHSQQVYGGLVIVPLSKSDEVLEHFQSFTDDSIGGTAKTEGLTVEYFIPAEGDGEAQILLWLIDTDAEASHAALQPFFDLEPKLLNQVYQTAIADYPQSIPEVTEVLMTDVTFVNDIEVIKTVFDITMYIRSQLSHVPGLIWDFQFEPLPRHLVQSSNEMGGNVLGLEDAEEDMLIMFLMPLWEDSQYSEDVNNAAELWYRTIKTYTMAIGKGHPFEFANYAAKYQDVMGSYGDENVAFLNKVAKKYDPSRLFQRAVGGFKL